MRSLDGNPTRRRRRTRPMGATRWWASDASRKRSCSSIGGCYLGPERPPEHVG